MVVTVAEGGKLALEENVSPLPKGPVDLAEEVYDLCCYIMPIDQAMPKWYCRQQQRLMWFERMAQAKVWMI